MSASSLWSVSMEYMKRKGTKPTAQMSSLPLCAGCHGGPEPSEAVKILPPSASLGSSLTTTRTPTMATSPFLAQADPCH